MGILDWVKSIFGDGDKELHITVDTRSIGKTKSRYIFKNKGDVNIIEIHGKPTDKELEELKPLMQGYENKEVLFLGQDEKKLYGNVRTFEDTPEARGLLRFFKNKIPARHFALMRTGLYIKYLRTTGKKEDAQMIRDQLSELADAKERRIVNLASAGYYQTYFRPLYNELSKQPNGVEQFNQEYNQALDVLNFAIFVHFGMSVNDVVEKVTERAVKNIKYGVRIDTITVHGIGVNVETVKEAVAILRPKFPKMRLRSPQNVNLCHVKIVFRNNNLTAEDFSKFE